MSFFNIHYIFLFVNGNFVTKIDNFVTNAEGVIFSCYPCGSFRNAAIQRLFQPDNFRIITFRKSRLRRKIPSFQSPFSLPDRKLEDDSCQSFQIIAFGVGG